MLLRLRARVKASAVTKVYSDVLKNFVHEKVEVTGVLITKHEVSTLTSKNTFWDIQAETGEILKMVMESDIIDFPREKNEQESVDIVPSPETVEHG